jgi:hypothetical protein
MRGRGLPDISIVVLNVIPVSIIITRCLFFKIFLNLIGISLSRLIVSFKASFYISCCHSLIFLKCHSSRIGVDEFIFV